MAELQQLWFLCVSVPELVILTHTMILNATFHSAPTSLLCFVMLQVVETNLVAFDCHWILINEVSATEMIHASRCVFVCLYFDLARHTGPERSVLWSRMQCSKVFRSSFGVISSPTTHKLMTKNMLFDLSEKSLRCTTDKNKKDYIKCTSTEHFQCNILKNIALDSFGEHQKQLAFSKLR